MNPVIGEPVKQQGSLRPVVPLRTPSPNVTQADPCGAPNEE